MVFTEGFSDKLAGSMNRPRILAVAPCESFYNFGGSGEGFSMRVSGGESGV